MMFYNSMGADMDVVVWLRGLGLGKYEAAFRENEVRNACIGGLPMPCCPLEGIRASRGERRSPHNSQRGRFFFKRYGRH